MIRHRESMIRYLVTGSPNSLQTIPKHSIVQEMQRVKEQVGNLSEPEWNLNTT